MRAAITVATKYQYSSHMAMGLQTAVQRSIVEQVYERLAKARVMEGSEVNW